MIAPLVDTEYLQSSVRIIKGPTCVFHALLEDLVNLLCPVIYYTGSQIGQWLGNEVKRLLPFYKVDLSTLVDIMCRLLLAAIILLRCTSRTWISGSTCSAFRESAQISQK
jgi:hypothetical protein